MTIDSIRQNRNGLYYIKIKDEYQVLREMLDDKWEGICIGIWNVVLI